MSKPPFKLPASYEAAMEELEQLTGLIESGQLPLEQLLTGYERGAELLKFCRDKLQAVEQQIKVLDEGTLKPWTQEGISTCLSGAPDACVTSNRPCPPGSSRKLPPDLAKPCAMPCWTGASGCVRCWCWPPQKRCTGWNLRPCARPARSSSFMRTRWCTTTCPAWTTMCCAGASP